MAEKCEEGCPHEEEEERELHDVIDDIGIGFYQKRLMCIVGIIFASEAMEIFLLTFIRPKLLRDLDGATDTMLSATSSIVFAGMLVGSTGFGTLSDLHGRRNTVLATLVLPLVAGIISCLAPNIYIFMLARFFVGIGVGGGHIAPSLLMELIPADDREFYVIVSYSWWSIGTLLLTFQAYLVHSLPWQYLAALACLPYAICLLCMKHIPESPRWLSVHNKVDAAAKILEEVAECNGKAISAVHLAPQKADTKMTMREKLQVVLSPSLRRTTLVMWTIWAVIASAYYGMIMLSTQQLSSSGDGEGSSDTQYGAIAFESLGEFPVYILLYVVSHRYGRKTPLTLSAAAASVFILAMKVFETDDHRVSNINYVLEVGMAFFGRSAALFMFDLAYMYTPEVYPTPIRTTATGLCSGFARLSSMLTPFVAYTLLREEPYIPYIFFATILIVAAIVSLLLTVETTGMQLSDATEDGVARHVDPASPQGTELKEMHAP